MRVLSPARPTAEQLKILQDYREGFVLIRGATGSGKTSTAVFRLWHVTGVWDAQRRREESEQPVRVLVLTYNRTLRGYVEQLVEAQMNVDRFDLRLDTFGHWARGALGDPEIVTAEARVEKLWQLGCGLGWTKAFLCDEVDYVLGRHLPANLGEYLDPHHAHYTRRGRGGTPQVDRALRQRLVQEVIEPYTQWKAGLGVREWTDIAVDMVGHQCPEDERLDIVVVDEAQDFSANQVRAISSHLAQTHSTTFVMDTMQRVYPRGFTWTEVGIDLTHTYTLKINHRNTQQIAAFALPLVRDLPAEDDGSLPDFNSCDRDGPPPEVVTGLFSQQMDWVTDRLQAIPSGESIALLHARGGNWLNYTRERLGQAGIPFVDLQRRGEWPQGEEQVGLSTLHSAKGLEFDHVIILGLAAQHMPHGLEENDTQLSTHRRLVAMAIGRARETVAVTYKPGEESRVIGLLDPATFQAVDL